MKDKVGFYTSDKTKFVFNDKKEVIGYKQNNKYSELTEDTIYSAISYGYKLNLREDTVDSVKFQFCFG